MGEFVEVLFKRVSHCILEKQNYVITLSRYQIYVITEAPRFLQQTEKCAEPLTI